MTTSQTFTPTPLHLLWLNYQKKSTLRYRITHIYWNTHSLWCNWWMYSGIIPPNQGFSKGGTSLVQEDFKYDLRRDTVPTDFTHWHFKCPAFCSCTHELNDSTLTTSWLNTFTFKDKFISFGNLKTLWYSIFKLTASCLTILHYQRWLTVCALW